MKTADRLDVRALRAVETRALRQRVLRPHQRVDELAFPGDDAPDTRHFGAFVGEALVSVASLYREDDPDAAEPSCGHRLRGMATDEAMRGRGLGAALLRACIDHAKRSGGRYLWCNARTTATGFYQGLGFHARGDVFELPGIGPHRRMALDLQVDG